MSDCLDKKDVIIRLCKLSEEVHRKIDPAGHHPSDCFCGTGGFWKSREYGGTYEKGYRNDGFVLEFIEKTIRATIKELK